MAFLKITTALLAAATFFLPVCDANPAELVTPIKRASGSKFPFGSKKVRGVNLGGWLVLEPWITPSIFEETDSTVVDEWTMSETLGKSAMETRMQKHWSTWITEKDLKEIAELGLNFVRIGIGYWSVTPLDGDPYVQGAYEYLGKALNWAESHGLKVMIDLHGAPGSQNGYDNSGRKGDIDWNQGDTVAQTYTALNQIRDDHASHPAVASIELLNEPYSPVLGKGVVEDFYTQGYSNLQGSGVTVSIQDAYAGINYWNPFTQGKTDILIDVHSYQIFKMPYLQYSFAQHLDHAKQTGDKMAQNDAPTICGEFSGAITDCTKWINGRNIGARYDGTYPDSGPAIGSCAGTPSGKVADLSDEQQKSIGDYIKAQITAFEKADGWTFWTWVTESAPEWNYKELAAAGVVPKYDVTADDTTNKPDGTKPDASESDPTQPASHEKSVNGAQHAKGNAANEAALSGDFGFYRYVVLIVALLLL